MRSTLKCDIIYLLHRGIISMKTKIIYISGNEIFDMNDIRCAFEEVRKALNLDQDTVLFGVPVDKDDTEITKTSDESSEIIEEIVEPQIIEETEFVEEEIPTESEITPEEKIIEISEPIKKRGRPKKVEIIEEPDDPQFDESETIEADSQESSEDTPEENDEKIVPILSILSSKEDELEETPDTQEPVVEEATATENVIEEEIIDSEIPSEEEPETSDDNKSDLEKLLSGVTPLNETEELPTPSAIKEEKSEEVEEENVDLTLEKLASEFLQNQDKIVEEAKNATPGKISKLRKLVPFKKKKPADDNVFGDLFGWAGKAANDDDFSVPGFFTRTDSKK